MSAADNPASIVKLPASIRHCPTVTSKNAKARGGSATLAPMDITNRDAMAQLCRSIYDRWGKIDLWVHTAIHAAPLTPAAHINAKDWDKSMSINATSMGILIPYIAPLLGEHGTAVFFDDPKAGKMLYGSYGASKAAQIALARSWQAESTGPRVEILQPADMPTASRARFFPGQDREAMAKQDQSSHQSMKV